MRNKYAIRPTIDHLEDRTVPASVRAVAGNLIITDPVGPLTVQTLAPGVINVADSAGSVTVGGIASLISIRGKDTPDVITFKANAAAFPGTVLINTLNGNDVVDLSGKIGADLIVLPGLGNDTIQSTSLDVKVGRNLTFADTAGKNTWNLNSRNVTVGLDLTYYGVGTLTMGAGNTLKVGRFATFTAIQPAASLLNISFNGLAVNVGRILTITGGVLGDTVNITSKLNVASNLFVSLAGGNNKFNLTPAAGGIGVNGNLFYNGGGGKDDVVLNGNAAIGGNSQFNLGNGANTFIDAAGTDYAGDLTIRGGNTMDTTTINGTVAGALGLFMGNGTNTTLVNIVPDGTFRYRGGNGTEILTLRGVGYYAADIIFGTGTNTFDIDQIGLVLFGTVIGTGGDNTFIQGNGELIEFSFLVNFP